MEAYILDQYISAFILFILGVLTVVAFMFLNQALGPKRKLDNQIDGLGAFIAYECGEVPIGDAQTRFNFQYYVFALIFVIFDVVTSFLLAWALSVRYIDTEDQLTTTMIMAAIFVALLMVGFGYWWKRNALRGM